MKAKKGDTSPKTDNIPDGLEQLKNALEAGSYKENIHLPAAKLEVNDAYLPLNHLFNAAAKKAFKKEVKTLIVKRKGMFDQDVIDRVAFFSCQAIGERNIFDAAKHVANTINGYASEGFVTGYLVKLSIIKLFSEEWELDKYVVFSYPCMTDDGYKKAQERGIQGGDPTWTEEGGIGRAIAK